MPEARSRSFFAGNLAAAAIFALALGLVLGVVARNTQNPVLVELAVVAKPLGLLWTNALRMVVLPLMISYLVLAINSVPNARTAGKLGGICLVCMLFLLGVATIVGVFVSSSVISVLPISDATRGAFRALATVAADTVSRAETHTSATDMISTLIPSNVFKALVEENHVGILITTALFAFAMTQIVPERRALLIRFFSAIADTARTLVYWIILALPVAAFALALNIGAETGFSIASGLGYAVLALSAILVVMTLLLYPFTALVGSVGMRRFGAAVAPAQTVAAGTRSSLASLPSLVEGAEQSLDMRSEVAEFVLPLTVTTFKMNYVISQPFKLLFLASMLGLQLRPGFLITFMATVFLLSFTTVGIPSGGQLLTWPLLLSAGIPIEALVMLKVADAIPDIFKTVLNVTADMSVATIVERFTPVNEKPRAVEIAGAA
ncbi:MAG: dicarboxylate/amino acid:cation symporter [Gemmatimonadaceae bacterium]